MMRVDRPRAPAGPGHGREPADATTAPRADERARGGRRAGTDRRGVRTGRAGLAVAVGLRAGRRPDREPDCHPERIRQRGCLGECRAGRHAADSREGPDRLQLGLVHRREHGRRVPGQVRHQGQIRPLHRCRDPDGELCARTARVAATTSATRPRRRSPGWSATGSSSRSTSSGSRTSSTSEPTGRTRATTRTTSIRCRTTGGRPVSPGTRARSRATSPAGRRSGTRRTAATSACSMTSRNASRRPRSSTACRSIRPPTPISTRHWRPPSSRSRSSASTPTTTSAT